ncbi:NUDIX domain-containing protein [Phaeobacter sp. NW0010-22]|uniref:NUDIX domain-containing protein n=1 Tax=Phaeobacter sp. NW0010-22 TaxID=3135907 RepID=UPI0031098F47
MTDLFFYGSLRYTPLLETVLGREASEIDMIEAHLPDHAVHAVVDQAFPMILHMSNVKAQGVLVRGLSDDDIARLVYYEGGFDYDLSQHSLMTETGDTAAGEVFFPAPGLWKAGEPWSLKGWIDKWGAMSLAAAQEVMCHYGKKSAEEIAERFPSIRIRAAARVAAQARAKDAEWDVHKDVVVHKHERPFLNFFAIDEMDLQFRQFDGSLSPVVNRSALLVGRAVVVLPYDPVRDTVLLIQQFRAPAFIAGDPAPWVWEAVAGLVDPGETPEETAKRETIEEAHLELSGLEEAGQVYSSTGSSGEFCHLFVGLADISATVSGAGIDAEGEDIRSQIISFDGLMAMVDAQQIKSLHLLAVAQWLDRHRSRLRAAIC